MFFSVVCFLLTSRMASNGTLKRLLTINAAEKPTLLQVRIVPVAKSTVAKSFLKATPKVVQAKAGKAGKGSGSDLVCKADKGSGSGPVPCPGKLPSKAWPSKSPAVKAMSKSAAVKAIAGNLQAGRQLQAALQAVKAGDRVGKADSQAVQDSGSDPVGTADSQAVPGTPPEVFVWPRQWVQSQSGDWYWIRGDEFWTYVGSYSQNSELAVWNVYRMTPLQNVPDLTTPCARVKWLQKSMPDRTLQLIFKAIIPHATNPPSHSIQ